MTKKFIVIEGGVVTTLITSHSKPPGAIEVKEFPPEGRYSYKDGAYVEASPAPHICQSAIATEGFRRRLFADTAWVRERAADQGERPPQEWLDYWQALRDITKQEPLNGCSCPRWPTPPST